jgi:hypothetical protein
VEVPCETAYDPIIAVYQKKKKANLAVLAFLDILFSLNIPGV